MTKRITFITIAAAVLLLGSAGEALAQFDTPNRAFHNETGFRLDGKHQTVPCASCHVNNQYQGTPATCFDCHWVRRRDDRFQTRLGTQCEQCHRPTAWSDVRWNHAAQSGQGLNSHHLALACESCHLNANFQAGSVTCVNCHAKNYAATTSPNHVAAGFPVTCDSCHKPSDMSFQNAAGVGVFNHNSVYPLVGVHATQACAACHKNNIYAGTPRDCVGCHRANYNATQSPNHVAANFPLSCDGCHRATDPAFKGAGAAAKFNHNLVFPLVGLHGTQDCVVCHKNNVYAGTPRLCVGCHQENFNRTTKPNHVAAGFSTSCETCHKPTDLVWGSGAGFNHNAIFALVGTHAVAACASCHVNNVYAGTPRTCVGCHQTKYTNTKNPPHVASGFSTTCETCHKATDTVWTLGVFNHSTVFALVGDHATLACTACHINNVYHGTARTCVGCHQTKYNATTNPPHAAAGFATTCETCHKATDTVWTLGVFNHSTVFALVGNHATAACTRCHVNNVYHGTARTCVGCHQDKYNATTNPKHSTAGFATTCETCHKATDTLWTQGTFTHTQFPLTGNHNVSCAQCHTTANNYAVFSCTVCHGQSQTDAKHAGRNGYVYDSNACYSCHPNGRAG